MREPNPIERLADAHVRAWIDLASSTAAVVALPVRTLQHLAGLAPLEAPAAPNPLAPRLAAAEAEAEALRGAIDRIAEEHRALVAELRRAYAVLEGDVEIRVEQAIDDQKRLLYGLLEPLLTQLPVVRRSIAEGRAVEGADVVALLAPLDDALARLGFAPIGEVGSEVPFDPALHQVAAGAPPEPGTPVTVKHVGYQLDDRLLRKARVSLRRKAPLAG